MKKIWMLCLIIGLVGCSGGVDQRITVESLGDQMAYNRPIIKAKVNQVIEFTFINRATQDIMKHNMVIINNKEAIDDVGKQALSAVNYLPDHASILAASELIGPGQETVFTFNVPSKAGEYPFICTFPGHYQMMQGIIKVTE